MRNKILLLLFWLLALPCVSLADNFVNLTPLPRSIKKNVGELVLPQQFVVGTSGLTSEMADEAKKFVQAFNIATGYQASTSNTDEKPLFSVKKNASLDKEAYKINVTTSGVVIEANEATGLYYAFQSIKKVLPPNVMAGVKDAKVTHYALPIIDVNDAPRFGYRGFMLDTSRHYFTVKEIKRVLEAMSYYKMNRFHWHLTDDQGWRIEIKKYPKLTSVGSVSDNSYMVDMHEGDYWLNQPYGPYFYTQDDVKEIVEYAKARHIDIVPEIDMPGHFCAAMAAYPEYSCNPQGHHQVITNIGGVYNDVMNVANPEAVQFAKDILTEIMDMFPGEYIHIGGDECPTTAWENNAECIAKKKEMGLNSFRELQSHFIKDMADHVKANGRKLSVWNEAITANGADSKTLKETGATVYCWVGADGAVNKATQLGMHHIYTPQVPWYINRKQSTDPNEPVGAGNGNDNLEVVYKQNVPVHNAKLFDGVQATFWSEYVAFGEYLEYLILPRLVAIAEAGWSPREKMNFDDFCKRISADSKLYDYNNYSYGKHYINKGNSNEKVMPEVSTTTQRHWYRIVTRAGNERANKCIELLRADAPLISQYKEKGAKEGRLWTNAQVTEGDPAYDYQFWSIEEDANQKGHYALVCKALPNGSVNAEPSAKNGSGRWSYDNNKKHYNFVLADNGYGKDGDSYYYSIRCDQISGLWLNASLGGQGFAVNLYGNPSDGNGGLWKFVAKEKNKEDESVENLINEAQRYLNNVKTYANADEKRPGYFGATETAVLQQLVEKDLSTMSAEELEAFTNKLQNAYTQFRQSFGYLEKNKIYTLVNTVPGFEDISIYDSNKGNALRQTNDVWKDNAWKVTETTINKDFTQSVKLQNVQTHRFIGNVATNATSRMGYAVNISQQGAVLVCTFSPETQDFLVSINGKNLYPISEEGANHPGTIFAGTDTHAGNAIRRQGAAWNLIESRVATFDCYDQVHDKSLGIYRRSWPVHVADEPTPPVIKNHTFVKKSDNKYLYKRSAYDIRTICRDQYGALLSVEEISLPATEQFTFHQPEIPYYTFVKAPFADNEKVEIKDDSTFDVWFTSNALNGVKKLGNTVTEVQAGHSYVIYDTSPNDASRKGFRKVNDNMEVNRNINIEDTDPTHTWLLEKSGTRYKVKNAYRNLYVPTMHNSQAVTLSKNGDVFAFTLNGDGETWKIKGSNGVCWDGLGNGSLVGWNDPGHPYKIYEYFVQPYFTVAVQAIDTEGQVLESTPASLVKAGETYTISTKMYEGYTLKEIQGEDAAKAVSDNLLIKIIYEKDIPSGIEDVMTENKAKSIYDLSGRKLQRISHKGIYIINGQKVLVK